MNSSFQTNPYISENRMRQFFRETPVTRLEKAAHFLDEAVRLPIIGVRVGFDPLLSFIPFLGTLMGMAFSLYFFWEASNLRVPWHVYLRMALNILIDAIAGAVPFLGVVTDALWKSNLRNAKLILKYARRSAGRGPLSGAIIEV